MEEQNNFNFYKNIGVNIAVEIAENGYLVRANGNVFVATTQSEMIAIAEREVDSMVANVDFVAMEAELNGGVADFKSAITQI
jgi:hypothetical protein